MRIECALESYCSMFGVSEPSAKQAYAEALNHYRGKREAQWIVRMRDKWYSSMELEDADLSLYSHPLYFCDLLACFKIYSSEYIKKVKGLDLHASTCLDLGCGLGLTTRALVEAGITGAVGTNIRGTPQYEFCESHVNVVSDHRQVGGVDLVFASEYFEHIYNASDHLFEVIEFNKPKVIVMANAFNAKSFGHYNHFYNGKWASKSVPCDSYVPCHRMGRLFSQILKSEGYRKMKTGFWNDRPNVWTRE